MQDFTVIPAIDLKDGCCVRLRQGIASEQTVYSQDPVAMAEYWENQGAAWLHVVDLDGAFQGKPVHTDLIKKIAGAVNIPVQTGGGLRTDEHIKDLIDNNIARVILGTRACRNTDDITRLANLFQDKLAVGIDARNGMVQISGWTETTHMEAVTLAAQIDRAGIKTLIYTDTSSDGMLTGPDINAICAVCEHTSCQVIASGGIAAVKHIAELRNLKKSNLIGAIVGKALYERIVTLKDLQSV